MKPGSRALGIAESFTAAQSTLCGAVVTVDGTLDGLAFESCTVGGLDATEAILDLWMAIDRPDIDVCFLSGIALAWFNIVELARVEETLPIPVIALSFEASTGLESDINRHFSAEEAALRRARYQALPDRITIDHSEGTVYARTMTSDEIDLPAVVNAFTRSGRRPEPVRIARLAARAADQWRQSQ